MATETVVSRNTIEAAVDDGRQLRRVHSLQPSIRELGHVTTCKSLLTIEKCDDRTKCDVYVQ